MNIYSSRLVILVVFFVLSACDGGGQSCDPNSGCQEGEATTTFARVSDGNYSISGTLIFDDRYRKDVDTPTEFFNRINPSALSNDSFDYVQLLPSPVALNGYLRARDSGPLNVEYQDERDIYRIFVNGGDQIFVRTHTAFPLVQAAEPALEIEAQVYSLDGALVARGTSSKKSPLAFSLLGDGAYLLMLDVLQGAGSYFLEIKPAVVQKLAAGADSFTVSEQNTYAQKSQSRPVAKTIQTPIGTPEPVEIIVKYRSSPKDAKQHALDRLNTACVFKTLSLMQNWVRYIWVPENVQVNAMLDVCLAELNEQPEIIYAERNHQVVPNALANDRLSNRQWSLDQLNVQEAWDKTRGSSLVRVALIDTGIISHRDLPDYLSEGYDFISSSEFSGDGDGLDPDPTDEGDGRNSNSHSFHGTHMAGIIGAQTNNGIGISGINWDVQIVPLRVLGIDGGTTFDVAQAIKYAIGEPNNSGKLIDQPVHIINLSLGSPTKTQHLTEAISEAYQKSVIVVAAGGNEGRLGLDYPAELDTVIAVGAVYQDNQLAPYSNRGKIDLVAPGGKLIPGLPAFEQDGAILSTSINDGYAWFEGTSTATAHVTGVIALMKSLYFELHPDQLSLIIANGEISLDLGAPGYDSAYGFGLIQADLAVEVSEALSSNPSFVSSNQGLMVLELYDDPTSEPVFTTTLVMNDSAYEFMLTGIHEGNYFMRVGQDLDFNGLICETQSFELCSQINQVSYIPIRINLDVENFIVPLVN